VLAPVPPLCIPRPVFCHDWPAAHSAVHAAAAPSRSLRGCFVHVSVFIASRFCLCFKYLAPLRPLFSPDACSTPPSVYNEGTRKGEVCISILHEPGEDRYGYEQASERWLPIHSVRSPSMQALHTPFQLSRATPNQNCTALPCPSSPLPPSLFALPAGARWLLASRPGASGAAVGK
jgi:hypothetical protein